MKGHRVSRIPEISLFLVSFFLNFFWEVTETYFYVLKYSDFSTMLYGWFHCTLGDVMITLGSFWFVSVVHWNRRWFLKSTGRSFAGFVILGVVYTLFSEWANVRISKSWAYNEAMPVIPLLKVGLVPIIQWIVIPLVTILLLRHHSLLIYQQAES